MYYLQGGGNVDDNTLLSQLRSEECLHATSDLCNDGVILPSETREVSVRNLLIQVCVYCIVTASPSKVIGQCLDVCTRYPRTTDLEQTNLSVLRM